MGNENGEWIMHGKNHEDPDRIKSPEELIQLVKRIGFLPLFHNEISGFSVEDLTSSEYWWTGNLKEDPWEWRVLIAQSKELIYGKFFQKKAGFVSLDWFPQLANYRRDGYDFDSLYDDQKASIRSKRIMDCFLDSSEIYSHELKARAGFQKVRGSDKEVFKNYQGIVTDLQMQTYLISKDFQRKKSKRGDYYGWPISIYTTPEALFGYDYVTSCYNISPEESKQKIFNFMKSQYPNTSLEDIAKVMK